MCLASLLCWRPAPWHIESASPQKRCKHLLYDSQFFMQVIQTLLHHLLVVQRRCWDCRWQTPIVVVAAVAAGLAVSSRNSLTGEGGALHLTPRGGLR